jgi:hypothetical protein
MRRLLHTVVVYLLATTLIAQEVPRFEVASIRAAASRTPSLYRGGPGTSDPEHLSWQGAPLKYSGPELMIGMIILGV